MKRRFLASALLLATMLAGAAARATTTDRVYLLATSSGDAYWSVDPNDPELPAMAVDCGGNLTTADGPSCLAGGFPASEHLLYFGQDSLFDAPVTVSPSAPLRFHLVLSVRSPLPFTVHLAVQRGSGVAFSSAGTEVAPGVYEGMLAGPITLDTSVYTFFGVDIRTDASDPHIDVATRGASWLQLPHAVAARGVPEMRAQDTYRPSPNEVRTAERSFHFNDTDYDLRSFDVPIGEMSSLTIPPDRPAAALYAWVEGFSTPTLYDVVRADPTAANGPADNADVQLTLDGTVVAYGSFGSLAEHSIAAGTLRFQVRPYLSHRSDTVKAYVLRVFGDRTLAAMRWRFYSGTSLAFTASVAATCIYGTEQIATTPAMSSFAVDLSWDTVNPTPQRWAIAYSITGVGDFPCGTNGQQARFTFPGARIWYVGPTPDHDTWFISAYDVRFEAEVTFIYAP